MCLFATNFFKTSCFLLPKLKLDQILKLGPNHVFLFWMMHLVGCVIQKRWADLLENALTAKKFLFYNSFSGNNLLSVIFLYIIWLLFTEQDFNLKTNVFLEKQQYFPFDKIFPRFKSNNVIHLYDITIQKQK